VNEYEMKKLSESIKKFIFSKLSSLVNIIVSEKEWSCDCKECSMQRHEISEQIIVFLMKKSIGE
jgi:CRISPR/Cas system CSM-associated protein Csm4 (group 5 of RAMP superfamily)